MASYHLSTDIVKRSLGYSAVAASAYANGIDFYNERVNKLEAYGRKRGVFHSEILAPESAPEWTYNRHELWNRVERSEKRHDAQVARTMVLALPHELPDEDKIALVNEFARDMFVSQGFVVDAGFHRADRRGDQRNDHAHLVISLRPIEGDDFARKKPRDFMDKEEMLTHWRERWAFYQNKALEEAGFDTKVDHRTLEEQGFDRALGIHMGRKATLLERRGEQSELGDRNREIEEHNRQIDALVHELAALNAEIAQDLEEEFTVSELDAEPDALIAAELEEEFSGPEGEVSLEEGAEKKEPVQAETSAEEGVFQIEAISNSLKLPASVWGEVNRIRDVLREAASKEQEQEASAPEESELQPVAEPEEALALTWKEQKASVDLFNSPMALAYKANLRKYGERTNIQGTVKDVIGKEATGREQGPDVFEERELTWEEQKASVDLFNSPMARAYKASIQRYGEIREYGLGKNWFDRTLTMFENLYYNTISYVRTAYERLRGGNEDPEIDQDIEPEDYEPGG